MTLFLTIAAIIGALLAGMILMLWLSPGARVRRRLRAVPVVGIAAARDGQWLRIVGVVQPIGEVILQSPLSAKRAVAYELDGSYHSSGGGNVGPARVLRAVEFAIEDGTGVAVVPKTPELRLGLDTGNQLIRVTACDAPEEILAALEPRVPGIRRARHSTVAMEEGVLEPGERAAVAGIARVRDGNPRIAIEPHPEHGILVSDAPSAGV